MEKKASWAEASGSTQQVEGELDIIGATYDDTIGILDKDGETLKWGDIYQMLKNQIYPPKIKTQMIFKHSEILGNQGSSYYQHIQYYSLAHILSLGF
jgi:hypothetical protein